MIYNQLASYYDALVKDDQATLAWVRWIEKRTRPCAMLELACGSGEITRKLHQDGFELTALDLSAQMIEKALEKSPEITFLCRDMKDLSGLPMYPAIACLCDSFNYILSEQEVEDFFEEVADHLASDGLFFFDTHSLDRLQEFAEEWNETGVFEDGVGYQWSILCEDQWLYQDFAFYGCDGHVEQEHHLQRVYDPAWLEKALTKRFDIVDVYTDFHLPGIQNGEKYFYTVRKKEKQ
jgi:SAM-dependent methyltransferase